MRICHVNKDERKISSYLRCVDFMVAPMVPVANTLRGCSVIRGIASYQFLWRFAHPFIRKSNQRVLARACENFGKNYHPFAMKNSGYLYP